MLPKRVTIQPLVDYLTRQAADRIVLGVADIAALQGAPRSRFSQLRLRTYWYRVNRVGGALRQAGWQVAAFDRFAQTVTFTRLPDQGGAVQQQRQT